MGVSQALKTNPALLEFGGPLPATEALISERSGPGLPLTVSE